MWFSILEPVYGRGACMVWLWRDVMRDYKILHGPWTPDTSGYKGIAHNISLGGAPKNGIRRQSVGRGPQAGGFQLNVLESLQDHPGSLVRLYHLGRHCYQGRRAWLPWEWGRGELSRRRMGSCFFPRGLPAFWYSPIAWVPWV